MKERFDKSPMKKTLSVCHDLIKNFSPVVKNLQFLSSYSQVMYTVATLINKISTTTATTLTKYVRNEKNI